jgi:hypothetical protein
MKYLFPIFLALATVAVTRASVSTIGSCHFDLGEGWKQYSEDGMHRMFRREPVPCRITIDVFDAELPKSQSAQYVKEVLPGVLERHGKLTRPMVEEDIAGGTIMYNLISRDEKADYYGFVVLNISPKGRLVQFAVEGSGDPMKSFAELYPKMKAVQWDQERSLTSR